MNDLRERYDFLFDGSGDLTQETLLLYVFGPLENGARQAVEQHLEECEMCRDAAEGMALLGTKEQAVAALAMADAKLLERLETLKQKVTRDGKEALITQSVADEPVQLKAEKSQHRIGWYRYAAAASVLVVVGVAFWLFNQTMQNQAEGIAMGKEDSLGLFKNAEQSGQREMPDKEETISLEVNDSAYNAKGGTLTTVDSGGAGGYTYMWANGSASSKQLDAISNGIKPGTYTVTVTDANGNSQSDEGKGEFDIAEKSGATSVAKDMPISIADEEYSYDKVEDVAMLEEAPAANGKYKALDDALNKEYADTSSVVGNMGDKSVVHRSSEPVPTTVNKGTSNSNFNISNAANMALTDASVNQAQYPGGMAEVQKYFDKIAYPVGTPKGYKGVITFEVHFDKKGKITKSSIVQGVGEPLDTLLYMHLKKMPNWDAPQPYGEPAESVRLVTVEVTVR